MRREGEISFEIIEYLGTLSEHNNGWQKEINLVSWNESEPKIDIRSWNSNHTKMSKGLILTLEEFKELKQIANGYSI